MPLRRGVKMDEVDRKSLQDELQDAADKLMEHCDAIVILASTRDNERDYIEYSYRGSYHTVLGLMEDFKLKRSLSHLEPKEE
jgi:hypothetical protein